MCEAALLPAAVAADLDRDLKSQTQLHPPVGPAKQENKTLTTTNRPTNKRTTETQRQQQQHSAHAARETRALLLLCCLALKAEPSSGEGEQACRSSSRRRRFSTQPRPNLHARAHTRRGAATSRARRERKETDKAQGATRKARRGLTRRRRRLPHPLFPSASLSSPEASTDRRHKLAAYRSPHAVCVILAASPRRFVQHRSR